MLHHMLVYEFGSILSIIIKLFIVADTSEFQRQIICFSELFILSYYCMLVMLHQSTCYVDLFGQVRYPIQEEDGSELTLSKPRKTISYVAGTCTFLISVIMDTMLN